MNRPYSKIPIVPEELYNCKWILVENEQEGFGADRAHPWYLDIWSIVIPQEARENAYFQDKPHLKKEQWGVTKNGLIAKACFKASSGSEGGWKVWRLELRPTSDAPLSLEIFDIKRRKALNQIEEHYTVYHIDSRVIHEEYQSKSETTDDGSTEDLEEEDSGDEAEDKFLEDDGTLKQYVVVSRPGIGSKQYGDWIKIWNINSTENLIRSIIADPQVTMKLAQLCPNPNRENHNPTANGVDAFKYGQPYTGSYSNIFDVMIFKEQSWVYKLQVKQMNFALPSTEVGPSFFER